MTPDERNLLIGFLRDLSSARAGAKDAEADGLIRQALAANPDAAYLLVQHTIVADQSLHDAQARIADLEQQLRNVPAPQPQGGGSFFGGGSSSPSPWGRPQQPSYDAPPAYAPEPRPSPFSGGGGLGSFLRSAGTTAAGVVAGETLFSGLEGMFGGHHQGFGGGFGGQGFMGAPEENVTINNYGDDSGGDDGGYDDGDDNS